MNRCPSFRMSNCDYHKLQVQVQHPEESVSQLKAELLPALESAVREQLDEMENKHSRLLQANVETAVSAELHKVMVALLSSISGNFVQSGADLQTNVGGELAPTIHSATEQVAQSIASEVQWIAPSLAYSDLHVSFLALLWSLMCSRRFTNSSHSLHSSSQNAFFPFLSFPDPQVPDFVDHLPAILLGIPTR